MPRSPNPVRSTAIPGGRQLRSYGDDADNLRYDSDRKRIYVGHGSGALGEIDEQGNKVGEIKLDAHPESFQLEKDTPREDHHRQRSANWIFSSELDRLFLAVRRQGTQSAAIRVFAPLR